MNRVRESGAVNTSPQFALQQLSRTQRIANAGLARTVESATFSTDAYQTLYWYREKLPSAVDILTVQVGASGARYLSRTSLAALAAYDPSWWRKTGSAFEAFAQVGRTLLVVYPAQTSTQDLTVHYSKLTTEYDDWHADYNTSLDLPDEDVEVALALAEVVLLMRARRDSVGIERRIDDLLAYVTNIPRRRAEGG
jgi:hypothetical protein